MGGHGRPGSVPVLFPMWMGVQSAMFPMVHGRMRLAECEQGNRDRVKKLGRGSSACHLNLLVIKLHYVKGLNT